ncbi:MAG: GFA family protein [Microvirga sp.]
MPSFKGGCQCGEVRYEVVGPPGETYVCHCRECQKQSASAFGISVMARSADVRLLKGQLQSWSRSTDTGRTLACFFCRSCGSRVWHGDKDQAEEISIKGGSFDDSVDLTDAIHIWTAGKLPEVIVPETAQQFPEEPE